MKTLLFTFIQVLKDFGIDVILIIAGFAGGIAFIHKGGKLTRLQKISTVLSGGLTANYLTPLVAEWFNLSTNTLYGIAFILGYGGLKSVEICFKVFQSKFSKQ